jgi:hypothetical protein
VDAWEHAQQRVRAQDVPVPAYALVGLLLRVRTGILAAPGEVQSRTRAIRATRDRWVTTAYQHGFEVREQISGAPAAAGRAAQEAWAQARALPLQARSALAGRVVDLRDGVAEHYGGLAGSGERAVAEWQAQRILDERAERLTRSVTPSAARATVSARDALRRASASPTGQRAAAASRRARVSARRAVDEYLAAIDDGAVTGQPPAAPSGQRPADRSASRPRG